MRILLLTISAFIILQLPAEGQSLKQVLEVGEESFDNRDYYSAFQCFSTLLKYPERNIDEEEIYLKYRTALSAQRFNYFEMADSMYQEVLKMKEAKNSIYKALATYNRAEVLYSMGTDEPETPVVINPAQPVVIRNSDSMYVESRRLFKSFINDELYELLEGDKLQERYRQSASIYIEECEKLLAGTEAPSREVYRLVNPGVNSTYSDINPVVLGNHLYYSSLRHLPKPGKSRRQSKTYSRVHRATMPGGNPLDTGLTASLLLESGVFNVNEDLHTVHSAFTADAQQFFFSSCRQEEDTVICQLYRRWQVSEGEWGAPEKLPINIDRDNITTTQPSVSTDCNTGQQWLYFVSNREGSVGGLDIWRSEIGEEGQLSPPERLPEGSVNTEWDEASPFFHTTSRRLYYSSTAPPGLGMYDIFYSQIDSTGSFTDRINLGLPINTGYNDQYFFLDAEGSRSLFSSDRPRSLRFREKINACCQDIYTYEVDLEMDLKIDLLTCIDNEPAGVNAARVRVFEDNCGQKEELEGSPFEYTGAPLEVPAQRLKRYIVEAELPEGGMESATVDLSQTQFNEEEVAELTINFFPEKLAYELNIAANIPENTQLEYKLVVEKDGITVTEEDQFAGPHKFRLEAGTYTFTVSDAFAFGEAGEVQSAEYDSLIYTLEVAPYKDRKAAYICNRTETKELIRKPPTLGFPIVFYFDNDKPDRLNGRADRSGQSYDETYQDYVDSLRIEDYLEYNRNNPDGVATFIEENEVNPNESQARLVRENPTIAKTIVERTMTTFFENEVVGQFNTFNNFMDGLIAYLADPNTNSLTINIQGFCSPLGGSAYNKLLAKRRIECIRNYMTNYRDGELNQYIDKKLFIQQEGVGVTQLFSNTPETGTGAVYDYRALLARKVEIKDVSGNTFQITTTAD
jgi:outer membrane protein OmpA-like peptidoglycan-associated protein